MAGLKGRSGPPANQNAFRHGLAGIKHRRGEGALTPEEQNIREEILAGLIGDKGGESQIGTAERILAEIISSDVALLVTFNQAIDGVSRITRKPERIPRRWPNWTNTNDLWSAPCRPIFSGLASRRSPKSKPWQK